MEAPPAQTSGFAAVSYRTNRLPENPTSILGVLIKFTKSDKPKGPVEFKVLPLQSFTSTYKKKDDEVLENENDPYMTIRGEAMGYSIRMSMFNCAGSFLVGGIYNFEGITTGKYQSKESKERKDEKKEWRYCLNVARVTEWGNTPMSELIKQVPFAQRCIRIEEDIFDPENADAFNAAWDQNHCVMIELKPSSSLPQNVDGDWFVDQPNETTYARLPDAVSIDYLYYPDEKDLTNFQLTMSGKKDLLQLWTNQRDENGKNTRLVTKTRLYPESLYFIMTGNWPVTGPLLQPHLCGILFGTVNRESTQEKFMCDRNTVAGSVFTYFQFHPDLDQTLTSASNPESDYQCAWKIPAKVAERLVKAIHEQNGQKPRAVPLPTKWINGVNLLARSVPEYYDDSVFSYFVLCNYNFVDLRELKKLKEMTDDQLFTEFSEVKHFPGKKRVIDVYATVTGKNIPMETAMRQKMVNDKKRTLTKAVSTDTTNVIIDTSPAPAVEAPAPTKPAEPANELKKPKTS